MIAGNELIVKLQGIKKLALFSRIAFGASSHTIGQLLLVLPLFSTEVVCQQPSVTPDDRYEPIPDSMA